MKAPGTSMAKSALVNVTEISVPSVVATTTNWVGPCGQEITHKMIIPAYNFKENGHHNITTVHGYAFKVDNLFVWVLYQLDSSLGIRASV